MRGESLVIVRDAAVDPSVPDGWKVVPFGEIRSQVLGGQIRQLLFAYRDVRLHTAHVDLLVNPFKSALLLRLLGRGRCSIVDGLGQEKRIGLTTLAGIGLRCARDWFRKPELLRTVRRDVERLSRETPVGRPCLHLEQRPVYLRTDLSFGIPSGGSVGHIAGVLNHLDAFGGKPLFLTTDRIPTVREDIETYCVLPDAAFWDFPELSSFSYNQWFIPRAAEVLRSIRPSLVYQRYSLNNFCGIELARRHGVPFVLEYNGSEVWMSRNWGRPLKHEKLSAAIETLNVRAADLVVVVSEPMKDELVDRGIDANKILVNPNGVDADVYSPAIDGAQVREHYGLGGKTVLGFIGTFGRWHGAEVLAEAFGRLLTKHPERRANTRLLLIGDGVMMPEVKRQLDKYQVTTESILTGLIPQEQGPAHLAACDVLVSPHVPNPDGSPFFGSPTKLFEYMAMGKGIVASDLDQIGEVLDHGQTAWMTEPGDVRSLQTGLKKLIDDAELRCRLGAAARRKVVARYTWREHTRRIVDALQDAVGGRARRLPRIIHVGWDKLA